MKPTRLALLACPGCGYCELEVTSFLESSGEIDEGYIHCPKCNRFYFIIERIARLITEDFSRLIDKGWAIRNCSRFAHLGDSLESFLERVDSPARLREAAVWSAEDMEFWERIYSNADMVAAQTTRVDSARADAGNRTYPRERHLFRYLRPDLRGKTLVDIGCGYSQSIQVLAPPDECMYSYVGVDLSIDALRFAAQKVDGDFIQASADSLPFGPASVDVCISLGTLHHLHEPVLALTGILDILKPGGRVALHEVIRRSARGTRKAIVESAHNDAIDARAALDALRGACSEVRVVFEYSAVRSVAVGLLGGKMARSPLLTRLVVGADRLACVTVGRVSRRLGARAMLVLGRKAALPSAPNARSASCCGASE